MWLPILKIIFLPILSLQTIRTTHGEIDMVRMIGVLKDNGYKGVLIPDHTPELHCKAPWHAGKAFAIGYMKALLAV
jgi:D-mannonate dehydratase